MRQRQDTFLPKSPKPWNICTFKRFATEISKLKTFCFRKKMQIRSPWLILVWPTNGNKTWRNNLSRLAITNLLELRTMSLLKSSLRTMIRNVISGHLVFYFMLLFQQALLLQEMMIRKSWTTSNATPTSKVKSILCRWRNCSIKPFTERSVEENFGGSW